MKKLILFLLLLLPIPALAQVSTTTPNLGLTKPCVAGDPGCAPSGDPNWGPKINGNFDILDARVPKPTPARVTVGTKPSSPTLNEIIVVTDGLGATDCNVAGGSNNVTCQWTGTAWVPVGGGAAGGGGGSTSFGSITSGSNSTATMVVGSGASLATSGSGSITATAVPLTGVTGQTSLVKNNQSNTFTTGDQNMSAASSFTPPNATGAAPTVNGRIAVNTTTSRLVYGIGGSTFIVANTGEIQPLNTNLTALSGLTGAGGTIPYFTGAGAMNISTPVLCIGTGTQFVTIASTNPLTWGCTTSTAGISGGTAGTIMKYASPTTATTSIMTEAAGAINIAGGLNVGTGFGVVMDPSALSADRAWTMQNIAGIPLVATTEGGAITDTNIAIFKTTAGITRIVNGGPAGSGTWNDSSTNTGDNKTLVAVGAGGTNTITTPLRAYWDAASLTLPSTSTCTAAALTQINSGPSVYTTTCTDTSTSTFEGSLTLAQNVSTVTFTLTVNDVDSSSQHFAGDFSAMCRNNGTTVNNTWGTSQSVDITMATAQNNYTGTTSAVTPNGTCTSGATLFWRFIVNTTPFTDDGDARVIGVLMKQAS